jgi:hypothetical protein
LLHVDSLEQVLNQGQETVVVDFLAKNRHHDRSVDVVEASFDVTLDQPDRPVPGAEDVTQSCVTS